MMSDLPGYGSGVYCRECYSTNHQTQQCPHMEDSDQGGRMMMMRLTDLLRDYTPGDGWSWEREFVYLRGNHPVPLRLLTMSIEKTGIREPILLGDDGRVWDGHHRIAVAHQLGLKEVPVEHAQDLQEDTNEATL